MGKAYSISVVLSERSEPKDPHLHYRVQFCNPAPKENGFFGALRLLRMTGKKMHLPGSLGLLGMTGGNRGKLSIVNCPLSIAIVTCYRIDKFSVGRYNMPIKIYL